MNHICLQPPLLPAALVQAWRIAASLIVRGVTVEEIRIGGRPVPTVRVRPGAQLDALGLDTHRYAWGRDRRGPYQRLAAILDGVQVHWEVRP